MQTIPARDDPGELKPGSAKSAKKVAAIVEKGCEILLESGLRAVNKRGIASQLGISDGNVSYYFPTRDALWTAVLEAELNDYIDRFHSSFPDDSHSAQEQFDDYVEKWVDEYQDRMVRVFFSQIITVGEIEPAVGAFRDRVYRVFFEHLLSLAKQLVPEVDPKELGLRVLLIMSLLEGLHAVSAFKPGALRGDGALKRRVLEQVNLILRYGSGA